MEVVVSRNTSSCLDISNSGGYSTYPLHFSQFNSKELSMSDLKTCLTEILNIEAIDTSTNGLNLSPENSLSNVVQEDEHKGLEKNTCGSSGSEKCFSKCPFFPPLHGATSSDSGLICEIKNEVVLGGMIPVGTGLKGLVPPSKQHNRSPLEMKKNNNNLFEGEMKDTAAKVSEFNGSAKPINKCYSRSMSLPVPSVSAMKGSREKQGTPPKKLSVTWAPDVYDPVPTSVSHVPSNKNQSYRSNSKKYGKYKNKGSGKSSRGSKGKDKKQVRKTGGGSTKLKPFHEEFGVGFGDSEVGNEHFDVGSPDPFCGSSFLKNFVTKMHFPVAEAT